MNIHMLAFMSSSAIKT